MASSDQSATATERTTDTERELSCPLCKWTADERTGIYQHLMVSHRKSELSRTLLSVLETDAADTPQGGQSDAQEEFDDPETRSRGLLL